MISINSKIQLKDHIFQNRVVVPPMASKTADGGGFVTDTTLKHYRRLTDSHASMVMVEYSYVHPSGRSEAHQLGIETDAKIKGLKKLSRAIKSNGAISGIQITHAGGKSETSLTDGRLISPSGVRVPVRNKTLENPDTANLHDINLIKSSFIKAARRAVKAGFDLIEIHAAHGYGINQWLSPITNQRSDLYGGNFENRCRLLFEIITEIRSLHPNILVSVRIPGKDYLKGGITQQDSLNLSKSLSKLGVDVINVSSGLGGWKRPRGIQGEGYLVGLASYIQSHISTPVIGVGGIKTKNYINRELCKKSFSFAAIGRAILESPQIGKSLNLY